MLSIIGAGFSAARSCDGQPCESPPLVATHSEPSRARIIVELQNVLKRLPRPSSDPNRRPFVRVITPEAMASRSCLLYLKKPPLRLAVQSDPIPSSTTQSGCVVTPCAGPKSVHTPLRIRAIPLNCIAPHMLPVAS